MKNIIARLRVIATEAVTWIIAAGAGLTTLAVTLTSGNIPWLPAWLVHALPTISIIGGLLTTAGMVIRRVTTVAKEQRGILPVDTPPQ